MDKILKLPKNLISKIAAGEVVERPASVVKELVENSIDAGANEISVYIEDGGKKSISVIDNGEGMSENDALNSFQLHTTSKIKSEADLESIMTFGFRGEALASVSAISEVTIHTYNPESKPTKIIVENSNLISNEPIPRSQGTSISVKDIFRHLPARKKFLKTNTTEYRHIYFELTKFALSKPDLRLKFFHNEKLIFDLQKKENLSGRIVELFKDLKPEDLIEFNTNSNGIKVSGFIPHPSKLSTENNRQYLFLNGRYVIDRTLNRAVKDGYGTTVSREKQPAYFLNIELDPRTIDINIHPRKLEVKIDNIQTLYQTIRFGLDNLLSKYLKNELQERVSSFSGYKQINKPDIYSNNTNTNYVVQNRTVKISEPTNSVRYTSKPNIPGAIEFSRSLLQFSNSEESLGNYLQIFDTYIILEKENKLLFIDQHAAHERINYEKFLNRFKTGEGIERQSLLLPIELTLNEDIIEKLNANYELIKSKTGIEFKQISENKIEINTQPLTLNPINFTVLINEIINSIENCKEVESEDFKHKLAAVLACHNSIRAGRKMEKTEISQLINDLFKCEHPYSCPHGRPIIWELDKSEIEIKFERK
jgi:DNA mismatch repair protein MutL